MATKDDKLKDLLFIYFNIVRHCGQFEEGGIVFEEAKGVLPGTAANYWLRAGRDFSNANEKRMREFLDKHYPMWDAIHGDVENIIKGTDDAT